MIRLDLAEILRIRKLDWNDGGGGRRRGVGKKEKGRRGGILLCNVLIQYKMIFVECYIDAYKLMCFS